MKLKSALLFALRWGGFVAVLYAGFVFYQHNHEQFAAIELDRTYIGWFYLAIFSAFVLRGAMQQALVTPFDVSLKHWEKLGLTAIPTVFNLLLPANAGSLYKFTYLGRVHGVKWVDFGIYLIVSWILITIADALIGLAALLRVDPHMSVMMIFLIAVLLVCVVVLLIPTNFAFVRNNRYLSAAHQSWEIFKKTPSLIWNILWISVLMAISNGWIIWTGARLLHVQIDITSAMLLASIHSLSTLVNLTPGSFGQTEALVGASTTFLGLGPIIGVTLSLVIRAGYLTLALVMAPIFYIPMIRKTAATPQTLTP